MWVEVKDWRYGRRLTGTFVVAWSVYSNVKTLYTEHRIANRRGHSIEHCCLHKASESGE